MHPSSWLFILDKWEVHLYVVIFSFTLWAFTKIEYSLSILVATNMTLTVRHIWTGWGVVHTGQFWHHPSTSPTVIIWKVVGQHLFLNMILKNLHGWNMMEIYGVIRAWVLRNNWLKSKTSGKVPDVLEESMECTSN